MAGICLCQHKECAKKASCLRLNKEAGDKSSFADFKQICNESNDFKWYWHMEEEKKEETPVVEEEVV